MWYTLDMRDKWTGRTLVQADGSYCALVGLIIDIIAKRPGGCMWTLERRAA